MNNLKLLLLFLILPLIACTQSIGQDSTAHSAPPQRGTNKAVDDIEARQLVNKLVVLYDGCQSENESLQNQVEQCTGYQVECGQTVAAANSLIETKSILITQKDSIIDYEDNEIKNFHTQIKDDKKTSLRRIVGFTAGGWLFGIGVTSMLYLLVRH